MRQSQGCLPCSQPELHHLFQDNRLTGDRRAQAAEACHAHLGPSRLHVSLQGFFGCDEFGHLYISDTAAAAGGCESESIADLPRWASYRRQVRRFQARAPSRVQVVCSKKSISSLSRKGSTVGVEIDYSDEE